MNIFFHVISLCLESLTPPSSFRVVTWTKKNHRHQENKFIVCKQSFHLVISMRSISCFTCFQLQLMLKPAFIVFLIPLRTCSREERQVPFGINFCADRSQPDSALLVQNSLWGGKLPNRTTD